MNLDLVHVVSTIKNTSSQVQQKDQGLEKPKLSIYKT
jgi:hypothetical protein